MIPLTELFRIADIHVSRIQMALQKLAPLTPITPEHLKNLSEMELCYIDLLVNRFAKLQDFLGQKIINAFLVHEVEKIDGLSMLDKLNVLERMEIIEVETWKKIRDARNHISHEYPDDYDLTARYLNDVITLCPVLINFLETLKRRCSCEKSTVAP